MRKQDGDQLPWNRMVLIIGLAALAGGLLLWLPAIAKSQQLEPRWETVLQEDFDTFPSSGWELVDNSTSDGGEFYWGQESLAGLGTDVYNPPITALWSVGAGAQGSGLTAGVDPYTNSVDSWAIYGPVDLQGAFDAELTFDWWLDTATQTTLQAGALQELEAVTAPETGDWLGWCVLIDRTALDDCQGAYVSGATSGWLSGTLSLKSQVMQAQATTATQQIWIAFHFTSDDDDRVGLGAFIDNAVLRINYGYSIYMPLARKDQTPTPTNTPTPSPTPTPSALKYIDRFEVPSNWITHRASSGLYGCDNARENLDYKYNLFYEGGRYKVNIPLDCRAGGINGDTRHIYPLSLAPGVRRPAPKTCIGVAGSFEIWDPWWSFWGLAFAASDDKSTVYTLEVNNLGDWAILKRTGYQYPGPNHPWQNETRVSVDPSTAYTGGRRWPANTAFVLNKLEAEIGLTEVKLFINDLHIYTINNPWVVGEIRGLNRVGILGGDWEIAPTQIGYDYFYVDEGCDTW